MLKKENKKTGFWIRFLARMIDFILFASLSIGVAFLFMHKEKGVWEFKAPILFYLWSLTTILIMVFIFLVTIFFWSRTLGMLICKIKVIFKNKQKVKSIFLRELVFSIGWITSVLIFSIVINHTMFSSVASYSKKESFSTFENIRLGFISTVSSFIVIFQLVFAMSIIVRGKKGAIHDNMSSTKTVWSNRYIEIRKESVKSLKGFKPRLVEKKSIEWIK